MRYGSIIILILRVSALPLAFIAILAAGMFICRGYLSYVFAALYVVSATGSVFIWVIKNVKASVMGYAQGESPIQIPKEGMTQIPSLMNSAADELALAARSHILSTLLLGYILIAFVFALAYKAVDESPAITISESFYFSLTTLATVGYGDISPQGFGRVLACVEMISGVAYNVLAIGGGAAYLLDLGKPDNKS